MMGTFWRFLVAAFGAAMLLASPAHAERDMSRNNGVWRVADGGGCRMILNLGVFYLDQSLTKTEFTDFPVRSISWGGPCGANGLANGRGSITIWVQQFINGRRFTDYKIRWTGEMRNGIMVGTWQTASTNFDSGRGDYEPFQSDDEPVVITDGCDKEWDIGEECNPQDGYRLQAQFGGAPAPAPAYSAAAAPVAAPVASPLTSGSGGGAASAAGGASPMLDTVASGLLAALGPRNAVGYATGSEAMDTVLAALRSTLGANGNAALGGNASLLETALSAARTALGSAAPNSTNAQLADLVMAAVRTAVAGGGNGGSTAAAAPAAPRSGGSMMGLLGGASPPPAAPPPSPAVSGAKVATSSALTTPQGNLVVASNLDSIAAYLVTKGDQVTRGTDVQGRPKLTESNNRYDVVSVCEDRYGGCYAFLFTACYTGYPSATPAKANEWNRTLFFGQTFIDNQGRVCLNQTVVTGSGGVPREVVDPMFDGFLWMRQHAGEQFK